MRAPVVGGAGRRREGSGLGSAALEKRDSETVVRHEGEGSPEPEGRKGCSRWAVGWVGPSRGSGPRPMDQ